MFRAVILAVAGGLVACGGMSKEDANKGFIAMQTALSQATTEAQNANALVVDHNVDFTYNCMSSGTAHLVGALHVDDSNSTGGGEVAFDYDVTLDECSGALNAIKTTGDITHSLHIVGDGQGVGSLDWLYKGNLTFTGDIEGECAIDLTWHLEGVSGQSASSNFEGEICGHEVSSSFSATR